jgi:hypothetical protein
MSFYIVQPGDTPMVIAQKLTGNPARMSELVRANAHKSSVTARVGLGQIPTFRELHVGERLTVPPAWESRAPSRQLGVAGHAYPQPAPAYAVRPRAGADGGGDDSGHGVEPILTIMGRRGVPAMQHVGEGVGAAPGTSATGKPCCGSCAAGGPCEGCEGAKCAVQMPPCSSPSAPPSIPGSTSFPVGFGRVAVRGVGQTATPTTTASTIGDALAGWGVPLAVGVISIAAGFGLAYVISNR